MNAKLSKTLALYLKSEGGAQTIQGYWSIIYMSNEL